ncbi:MAG: hypothetical protein QOF87_3850 [Pseudonocardiales bacterium]|jgi:hypothetical protein|nr:hypothetical protein [Pseudonocardiales bacterium]MDT5215147.1 hypothetical protein [Mycobacterium sp.]MDT7754787.1 hypothetical protein [Mycobacterium sp.]
MPLGRLSHTRAGLLARARAPVEGLTFVAAGKW